MKKLFILIFAALILLSACNLPAVASTPTKSPAPTKTRIPSTMTPLAPTPTSLPSLKGRFGDQQLILDQLIVQGKDIAIPGDIQATLTLGSDGKVTGKGGCNSYFSTYESTFPGSVKFAAIGATKMFCRDKMEVESGLFQVLAKVERYSVENTRLILQSNDGQYLARFDVAVK